KLVAPDSGPRKSSIQPSPLPLGEERGKQFLGRTDQEMRASHERPSIASPTFVFFVLLFLSFTSIAKQSIKKPQVLDEHRKPGRLSRDGCLCAADGARGVLCAAV